jgi:hypothetical protein
MICTSTKRGSSVEALLNFVYEVQLESLQVFDIPVVDDEVVIARDHIRYDNLVTNYGLKD